MQAQSPWSGYITPQYHIVFDDWFATVATNVDALPDFNTTRWARLFGDSRYQFPFDNKTEYFIISDEKTEFCLTGDHKVFWIPGDYDSQEYVYNETKISEIDISKLEMGNGISLKTIKSPYRVQSPLMMKTGGRYMTV
jgi:hypothetical protein